MRERGGVTDTNRFERMQKIQGRQRARVTVFSRSSDLTVGSVVFNCSIGAQNQNERPENECNRSPLKQLVAFLQVISNKVQSIDNIYNSFNHSLSHAL